MSATAALAIDGLPPFAPRAPRRPFAPHEFMPTAVLYAPVIAQWMWLALRYRSGLMLPCLANPHVPTGGLCGESKTAILDQMAGPARARVAPYAAFDTGPGDLDRAHAAMNLLALVYPVVLKPDVGCRGVGVRLVADAPRLAATLAHYPAGTRVLVQDFVAWEGEAGILYSREPSAERGRITGLTLKHIPAVEGDGVHTLLALIEAHPRAGKLPQVYLERLAERGLTDLDRVLSVGERFPLVFTGNHSKGCVFRAADELITPALEAAVDQAARALPDFHHGRLDIRFRDISALRHGEDWKIIEINGIGAEPINMWDPDRTMLQTMRMLTQFWRDAFRIGAAMQGRGHRAPSLFQVIASWRHQEAMIATYPSHD